MKIIIRMMKKMTLLLLLIVGILYNIIGVNGRAILGVDLGSLYMKVALVQSGSPLEIVTNLHSKRKTEQLILFDNDSRYYGADAAALLARKSHITPAAMSLMLGRDETHPTVQVLAERHYPIRPQYNESRSGVTLKVDGQDFTPEELVAMVLSHAVDISVAYSLESGTTAIAPPRDVVLTVSSFSTQKERQALLDAAELANLNVLTLIDETTAAALHYAMDKSFEGDAEQILLFYNMGGSSLQVSLVRFFNYMQPQKYGAAKSTPALEVLAKAWDPTLGGDAIDHIIVEMIANNFNAKWQAASSNPSNDVRTIPRAMMKIRLQANKVKHVLSANNEIPIHMDSVHADISISMKISRTELEEQLEKSGMLQRAIQPVLDVLKIANKTVNEINGTELLGGGMRVPRIQTELHKIVAGTKNEPLGLHINADESFALGAAFAGANISTAFRVRQVGMTDINPFPIQVSLNDMKSSGEEEKKGGLFGLGGKKKDDKKDGSDEDTATSWSKQAIIFKSFAKMNVKKTIAFTHDKDVECALDYVDDETSSLLPAGTDKALERYQVKGIVDFVKDMTDKKLLNSTSKPKVSLQFELSPSGIASLIKAEVAIEETYIAQEKIEIDDDSPDTDNATDTIETNTTADGSIDTNATTGDSNTTSNTTTSDGEEANTTTTGTGTGTTPKSKPTKKKKKTITVEKTSIFGIRPKPTAFISQEKKRIHKKALNVTTYYISRVQPHTPELFASSRAKLIAMAERDKERMMLQEAKNKVESYIYKIKNKLADDEDAVAAVTTEEQRDEVLKLATDAGEWLDDDGYDADLKTMEDKYLEISIPFEKILLRMSEIKDRPAAVAALTKKLGEIESLMKLWEETKPHITVEERDLVLKQALDIRTWMEEKETEQSLKKSYEDPAFVSTELPQKTKLIETLIVALDKKPAPKSKKDKKKKNKGNNETDTDTNTTDFNATDTNTNTTTNETSSSSTSEKSNDDNSNNNKTEVPASGAEEEL